MFLRKKAQSTAEYAILIALIIGIAAGALSITLKGALRDKNSQAVKYLLKAGNDQVDFTDATSKIAIYSQEHATTTLDNAAFVDESAMQKGGREKKVQRQAQETESYTYEAAKGKELGE